MTHFEVIFAECEITVLYTLLPYKLQNDNSQTFMKKVGIREEEEQRELENFFKTEEGSFCSFLTMRNYPTSLQRCF